MSDFKIYINGQEWQSGYNINVNAKAHEMRLDLMGEQGGEYLVPKGVVPRRVCDGPGCEEQLPESGCWSVAPPHKFPSYFHDIRCHANWLAVELAKEEGNGPTNAQ